MASFGLAFLLALFLWTFRQSLLFLGSKYFYLFPQTCFRLNFCAIDFWTYHIPTGFKSGLWLGQSINSRTPDSFFLVNSLYTALKYAWGHCLVGIWTHDQSDSTNGTLYLSGISTMFHCRCNASGIKTFSSFSEDLNTRMLTKEVKLGLVRPEYLLPVINSPVFVLSGECEVFLDVCIHVMVILETFSDSDPEAFISAWRSAVVFLLSLVPKILRCLTSASVDFHFLPLPWRFFMYQFRQLTPKHTWPHCENTLCLSPFVSETIQHHEVL